MVEWPSAVAELDARRRRMSRDGYRECDMPACNCGSWHKQPSRSELELLRLVRQMLDHAAPDDPADGVLDWEQWKAEARDAVGRAYATF